jgi:hypothetical protein
MSFLADPAAVLESLKMRVKSPPARAFDTLQEAGYYLSDVLTELRKTMDLSPELMERLDTYASVCRTFGVIGSMPEWIKPRDPNWRPHWMRNR